jgi:hypothetical protein
MKRYVEGENRSQSTLFPESLDDYIGEDNPVRIQTKVDDIEGAIHREVNVRRDSMAKYKGNNSTPPLRFACVMIVTSGCAWKSFSQPKL